MTTTPDPFDSFKATQREVWSNFALNEGFTTPPAAALVQFAHVSREHKVLDVACGTAVVAVTAARLGAKTTGLDLTPALLERARENAALARVDVELIEGDAEKLPFPDSSFDVVLSQFGHIFAPRPELATSEMLRVLKPGGRIAFTTWPPGRPARGKSGHHWTQFLGQRDAPGVSDGACHKEVAIPHQGERND